MIDLTIPPWPCQLFASAQSVSRGRLHPVNMGPEPIANAPQSVQSDAGRWTLRLKQIPLSGERVLLFRALIAELTSPLKPVYVQIGDVGRTPRAIARAAYALGVGPAIPFSDSSYFSDEAGFAPAVEDYALAADAPLRATSLTVAFLGPAGVALQAGQIIGLQDRAYIVKKIWASADGVAGHYDLTIWPPLRDALAAAEPVNTETPFVRCIVDPKSAEAAEDLALNRIGYVDLDFVEASW